MRLADQKVPIDVERKIYKYIVERLQIAPDSSVYDACESVLEYFSDEIKQALEAAIKKVKYQKKLGAMTTAIHMDINERLDIEKRKIAM